MTTIAQIITDAYQTNNLIAINVIPTADEQAKGLRALNRIFRGLIGNELGDRLQPLNVGTNNITRGLSDISYEILRTPYLVPTNSRLVLNLSSSAVFYLPTTPQDGSRFAVQDKSANLATYPATIVGNGNTIDNATQLVIDTNSFNQEWFFREDLGDWQKVSNLALSDSFPLPEEFEELFISLLALRIDPAEGVALDDQIGYILKEVNRKFKARYRQKVSVPSEIGLLYLTGATNQYNNGYYSGMGGSTDYSEELTPSGSVEIRD